LVQVAPFVFADGLFAHKDGTAINLFLRDLPRLFIDLDLVFPNYKPPRVEASAQINEGTRIRDVYQHIGRGRRNKLSVRLDRIEVKIEANFVLRGTVHSLRTASLTSNAREILLAFAGNSKTCSI